MKSGGPRLPVKDLTKTDKQKLKNELIDLNKLKISLNV